MYRHTYRVRLIGTCEWAYCSEIQSLVTLKYARSDEAIYINRLQVMPCFFHSLKQFSSFDRPTVFTEMQNKLREIK